MFKRLMLVVGVLSTTVFSSFSFADWTKVAQTAVTEIYVDFGRIKKIDGHLYVWRLTNYSNRDKFGDLSNLVYEKIDCVLGRTQILNRSYFSQKNANGTASAIDDKPQGWDYPRPSSAFEVVLKVVCE